MQVTTRGIYIKSPDEVTRLLEHYFQNVMGGELELSRLHEIRFTFYFEEDVAAFQARHGIPTGNLDGCQVKTVIGNGCCKMFVRDEALRHILKETPKTASVLNRIHYELAAVHEYHVNHHIRNQIVPTGPGDCHAALRLWGEYIAARLSAPDMPSGADCYFDDVRAAFVGVPPEIEKAAAVYRSTADFQDFFHRVHGAIGSCMLSACRSLGFLDGLPDDGDRDRARALSRHLGFLADPSRILALHRELGRLYGQYPHWRKANILKVLEEQYFRCWSLFDLKATLENDRIQIVHIA